MFVKFPCVFIFPDLSLSTKDHNTGGDDDGDDGAGIAAEAAAAGDDDDDVFSPGQTEVGQLSDLVERQDSHDAVQQEVNETQKTVCLHCLLFVAPDLKHCS